ncbi:excinuclease ABC subunit UvrA [Alkalibacter mobilis]|uniref:excinuclease ABC subunit UvrA n=1 Tax=Alkalibacter mobilis TaxID=2787712 RepID=UPI00189CB77D|nr:excinuclease ABC subunit UvrA [Alkalibacter mobilis]MBF7097204.1 excinuclease ABC subunit UvrA [Alkalibacter mobilis]
MDRINIVGAKEHNLKNINITLPRDKFIVFTGLSGSGKSSLAFDTIYAEGQRRYVESLSSYARQFLGQMNKPDVDYIEGLSPAISIDQKTTNRNPRSTVGTVTEIYDHLRLLYARMGIPHCPKCGKEISSQSVDQIVESVLNLPEGEKFLILAPIVRGEKGQHKKLINAIKRDGFIRVVADGELYDLNEEEIELDKNKKHNIEIVVDRLKNREGISKRLTDSIETALKLADGMVYIDVVDGERQIYSEKFACPDCNIAIDKLEPRMFSFNNPFGMCTHCNGLGSHKQVDPDMLIRDKSLSINKGALNFFGASDESTYYNAIVSELARLYDFSMDEPIGDAPEDFMNALLYGDERPLNINFNSYFGGWKEREVYFEGLINNMERRYKESSSDYIRDKIEKYMSDTPCNVCKGKRLNENSLAVTIKGKNIIETTDLSISECYGFFDKIQLTPREAIISEQVLKEIKSRIKFLMDVGLDYLTLSRNAGTLSGGESQRIRLATQIGSALVGVLYVLDEPSIGLHQRDNNRLLATLRNLTNLGNTLIVVEHDEDTIKEADHVVDIGPGAGIHGGEIIAEGTWEEIMKNKKSITGQYLSGERSIHVPEKRREGNGEFIEIIGAAENNLKNINVSIPLGKFVAVTGVSGSGKSTLINEILYKGVNQKINRSWTKVGKHEEIRGIEHVDKIIDIDQSPIGRTPRSNPATYTGVFDFIRDLFSQTPEAKTRGYKKGRFSFNVKGGRCENCSGDGIIKIEMHFLPDVYVPCEVCKGKRYNKETLQVKYKGKNISEILEMSVEEGVDFFQNITKIKNKLQTLYDVGLGYIKLGQPSTQLSGGEAQRIKLATELSKRGTGKTLYILDEPTTGLHMADVDKLITVLNKLADAGNTIVVIEHNLDVIKVADHVIDLGPEGGFRGGNVIAEGTPEKISENNESFTGQFLKKMLQ